jgi:hypothetical protein
VGCQSRLAVEEMPSLPILQPLHRAPHFGRRYFRRLYLTATNTIPATVAPPSANSTQGIRSLLVVRTLTGVPTSPRYRSAAAQQQEHVGKRLVRLLQVIAPRCLDSFPLPRRTFPVEAQHVLSCGGGPQLLRQPLEVRVPVLQGRQLKEGARAVRADCITFVGRVKVSPTGRSRVPYQGRRLGGCDDGVTQRSEGDVRGAEAVRAEDVGLLPRAPRRRIPLTRLYKSRMDRRASACVSSVTPMCVIITGPSRLMSLRDEARQARHTRGAPGGPRCA